MSEICFRVDTDSESFRLMYGTWDNYIAALRDNMSKVGPPPEDNEDA